MVRTERCQMLLPDLFLAAGMRTFRRPDKDVAGSDIVALCPSAALNGKLGISGGNAATANLVPDAPVFGSQWFVRLCVCRNAATLTCYDVTNLNLKLSCFDCGLGGLVTFLLCGSATPMTLTPRGVHGLVDPDPGWAEVDLLLGRLGGGGFVWPGAGIGYSVCEQ